MTDSIRSHPEFNVHAVLIERDGRLVYEEYFSGKDERWGQPLGIVTFTRATLHDLRSVTKSVVSALVGIASRSGAIPSLDAPLLDYFPEYKDLDVPERRRITIRHALMMSVGLEWNEDIPYTDPKNDEIVMTRNRDPLHYVLARPIVSAPGTSWRYNGGTTQVLGTIVQRATKRPLAEYARAMLFAPLGIREFEWLGSLAGVPSAASGLRLRPRDLAKFGSLYLHDGRWNGRQVLPREWVHESTRRRLTFPGQQAQRVRISVVARLLSDAIGSRRGTNGGGERHTANLPPARATHSRDRPRRAIQRLHLEPSRASAPRLHPSSAAAGPHVRVSVMRASHAV